MTNNYRRFLVYLHNLRLRKQLSVIFIFIPLYVVAQPEFKEITATFSEPLSYSDQSNFVIEGKRITTFSGSGIGILLNNCHNVIIRNCIIGPTAQEGIFISNSSNIRIENCSFEGNITGVYAFQSNAIGISNNQFSNPKGDHKGGPQGQIKGAFVQFNGVTGANNYIAHNVGESILGISYPQDLVNMFHSGGTEDSPLLIFNNKFRGGGTSSSGGGILVGDGGEGNYITVQNNILINPGQYGLGIVGGHHNKLIHNIVFGEEQCFTNVGLYVADFYNNNNCEFNEIKDNQIYFINGICDYTSNGTSSGRWIPSDPQSSFSCSNLIVENNNWEASYLNDSILPENLLIPDNMLYLSLDDNILDSSGNQMQGRVRNVVYESTGKGLSAFFNGINSSIQMGNRHLLTPGNNKISVSAWVKPENFDRMQGIARSANADGFNSGWRLLIDDLGRFMPRIITEDIHIFDYRDEIVTDDGEIVCNTIACDYIIPGSAKTINGGHLQKGRWNNVVLTYDGKKAKVYVNGELRNQSDLTGEIKYNLNTPMIIGHAGGAHFFDGNIDEFKLYRGVLNEEVIQESYEKDLAYFNGVVLNYEFDGDASDSSINGINGVKVGGNITSTSFNTIGGGYISSPKNEKLELKKNFTVSAIIKPESYSEASAIIRSQNSHGYRDGWRMILNNQNLVPRITTENGSAVVHCDGIKLNDWNHVAFSYDGNELKGYVNGVLKSSALIEGKVIYPKIENMLIANANGATLFNGEINDISIFDFVCTDQEISILAEEVENLQFKKSKPQVNITKSSGGKSLKIFPNPVSGGLLQYYLQDNTIKNDNASATIQIFDITGKVVVRFSNVKLQNGFNKLTHLNLKNGIYYLMVNTDGIKHLKNFVVKNHF